ncbi:MAG TPA: CBS domain-containing protein [Desulfurococcaceae archaeon]|nr:CBS domain-containing protein [Desulfurococcaceae archaeon]
MPAKVSSYMTSPVIAASPYDNLAHIRNLMIRHHVGRVVIVEDSKPIGIITKSDFIRALFSRRRYTKPLEEIKAEEVMTKELIVIEENKSIKNAAKLMIRYGISGLPVVTRDGGLVGIITLTDLTRAYAERYRGRLRVFDAMRKDPPIVSRSHSLFYIADLLSKDPAGKVIVVEGNKPVGIITKSDVAFLNTLLLSHNIKYIKRTSIEKGRATAVRIYAIPIAADIMTPNPLTTKPLEDLALAADTMIKNNISGLPVVDDEGILMGIVTKIEIARALSKL